MQHKKTEHRRGRLFLQDGKTPVARRHVGLLQILLHVAAVPVAHVPLQVAPRTGRTLVEGGAAVHAVGHALRIGLGEVGGARAAVVDAADAQEASCRARDVVYCVVEGRAVRVVGRPRRGGGGCICGASGAAGGRGG